MAKKENVIKVFVFIGGASVGMGILSLAIASQIGYNQTIVSSGIIYILLGIAVTLYGLKKV